MGETTTYKLDAAGNPIQITDPMQYVTVNTFDSFNNLLASKHPDGGVDGYSYNGFPEMTSQTNPVGDTFSWGFDPSSGYMTSSTDGAGNTTTYVWTGNVMTSMSAPPSAGSTIPNKTTFGYDGNLRQISSLSPMGALFLTGYDNSGNPSSVTGPLGKTQLTFDGTNELVQSLDPAGNKTGAAFYADGDPKSDSNARGF